MALRDKQKFSDILIFLTFAIQLSLSQRII
jgi:hypothetical protein